MSEENAFMLFVGTVIVVALVTSMLTSIFGVHCS